MSSNTSHDDRCTVDFTSFRRTYAKRQSFMSRVSKKSFWEPLILFDFSAPNNFIASGISLLLTVI